LRPIQLALSPHTAVGYITLPDACHHLLTLGVRQQATQPHHLFAQFMAKSAARQLELLIEGENNPFGRSHTDNNGAQSRFRRVGSLPAFCVCLYCAVVPRTADTSLR